MDSNAPRTSQPAHESRFHYSKPNYAQPSQYQQFPPHPGVRPPPNAKLSARQVPAGVGVARVAPPPVRYESPPSSSEGQQQQRTTNNGTLLQDFKFPMAPPMPGASSSRSRQEPWASPPERRDNMMHDSYMSSVVNDFTPGTTPATRSRGFPTPQRRYSGSVYAESEALGYEERLDSAVFSPETNESYSPDTRPQVVRQASLGKRAKPALTTIRNRESTLNQNIPEEFPLPPTQLTKKSTIEALSAAVAAGMSGQPHVGSRSNTPTPLRMPFDTSPPASPSADREFLQTPKTPMTMASTNVLSRNPGSLHSQKSINPLLGLGIDQPAMSDKIPPNRRPPRLDIDAVREAEARGSTTSLADLIKRATRLAANLDRGKTASRLGMLDMFGSSERLNSTTNRHSTMSDMLSAFPAPAIGGTPTNKRDTAWPLGEKDEFNKSNAELSRGIPNQGRRRKCCGMSLPVFFAVLLVIIILIAAAVLIPVFLILVPNQHKNDNSLSNCPTTHPCQNGGTSVVSNDACACVCSNGFTGSSCQTASTGSVCATVDVTNGDNDFKNATIGSSISTTFSDAQTRFDIPLNASKILTFFSANNLSCAVENSIADFNSSTQETTKTKRFIMLPEFDFHPSAINGQPQPPHISARAVADCLDQSLERRQDDGSGGTSTSNGIVFQASSATVGPIDPSATVVSGVSTVTSVSASADSTPSPTASSSSGSSTSTTKATGVPTTVSNDEIDFAKVVVLYVLEQSLTVNVAINAQTQIESFFSQQTQGNVTSEKVNVGTGNLVLTADFDKFSITDGKGQVVGGQS